MYAMVDFSYLMEFPKNRDRKTSRMPCNAICARGTALDPPPIVGFGNRIRVGYSGASLDVFALATML